MSTGNGSWGRRLGPLMTPRCCSRARITPAIRRCRQSCGNWATRRCRRDVSAPDVHMKFAVTELVIVLEEPPAVPARTHYSNGRGEFLAFGRPATVAADGGAGESQRWRSHHRVLLWAEGGGRFQLADQPAAEPGRVPGVGSAAPARSVSPEPR